MTRRADLETPLTTWLRAVLWGAILVPLIAFLSIAWWGYERALREAETLVAHACELAYLHAERTFDITHEIALRADAATSGEDDVVRANEAEVHRRLADMTSGLPSIVNLNVWDANGRPLARSDIFPVDPAAKVGDRAYFRQQRDKAVPLGVSEVVTGRQSGRELVNATVRRSSLDGSFRGIVAVSLAPSYFRDYYQTLSTEQPNLASFALIRLDGELLARWPQVVDGRTQVPAGSPILKQIREGAASGSIVIPENNGRETRLTSFRRLEKYPLYVVAGVSRRAMFANWFHFVELLAAILLPITALLVYVSWVALKKTQREAATARELQEQIERRAAAEQTMLQSQRLETMAIVTGGVAHDFNNLLAIVNTSLHILVRRHPEVANEKQTEAMSRAIQTGVRLTRQLLSFTRKQALRPETVQLQTWLPGTLNLVESSAGANVVCELRVDADTQAVLVDVGELELALINLVVNARHAMPQGGTLLVHASNVDKSEAGGLVSIAVRDTGSGIPAEVLPKVFEPFFTTRSQGAGSGLGLSQVQGFCQQAGGFVEIDSAPGRGTTVWMHLPAAPMAEPVVGATQRPSIRLEGQVLLVEDNDDVGATTESMLQGAGLDIVRLRNGDAALAYLRTAAAMPDIVLSDIAMPGSIDGIALAFTLRRDYPALVVLLTTGYAERLHDALAGGFRVLAKPVDPDDMLAELQALLKANRPADMAS